MKHLLFFFLLLPTTLMAQDYAKIVNPFIGTGGHGHTFPGATAPFGFCQLSPDTRIDGSWDGCGGYHYSDSVIYGFSHTHLSGTGVSDYGDILLMPVTTEMMLDNYQYKSTFSHANEKAEAGYYQVFLEDPKVNVELTTSRRCGFHKYTFPENAEQYVVLDLAHRDEVLDSKMEQIDAHTIRGYRFSKAWATNQKVFYEIKFENEIETILYEQVKSGSQTIAIDLTKSLRALIKLKMPNFKNPNVKIKVGISGVDKNGAHNNLEKEIPHWDFYKTKKWVQDEWNEELSKIKVSDNKNSPSTDKKIIFYTALYHCMIAPNIYSDVDNRYRGRDDKIHNTEGKFDYYTVFSLWDTYRALHPLLTIIDKKRTNDFINTFIKQYEQGGRLPVWELSSNETNCMIGYHAVSVIWDAYNKGIRDYDAEKAFEAMKSIATEETAALKSYMRYGYVRAEDDHESVSKTLEYAYDDWCIAQMAKALGKEEDYKIFEKRSHNWINVYDPTTGFMRARKNSTLIEPFSPYLVDNNYTEANAWQYSFYVPHDVEGLISISGGATKFEEKLDALFSASTETIGREQSDITGLIGQYAHGNEPSHHIAYLYHRLGKKEKGNKIIQKIMNEFYTNSPDGLIGNEDCGQMSAWYVMNKLGLYSICPGKSGYISFNLENPIYEINDVEFDWVQHTEEYESDFSYIYSKLHKYEGPKSWIGRSRDFVPVPFIIDAKRTFKDSAILNIFTFPEYHILYSLNGSRTSELSFGDTITIKDNSIIEISAFQDEHPLEDVNSGRLSYIVNASPIQTAIFTKLPNDKAVFLNCQYSPTYHAGGPMGLVDGIHGSTNWRAGDWQGYQGQDFEAVIKYTGDKDIDTISANFLIDQRAWIFLPTKVECFVSTDSVYWELLDLFDLEKYKSKNENVEIKRLLFYAYKPSPNDPVIPKPYERFTVKKFRGKAKTLYIKIKAKNYGVLPEWHPGAGHPAYIFIDEIEIK